MSFAPTAKARRKENIKVRTRIQRKSSEGSSPHSTPSIAFSSLLSQSQEIRIPSLPSLPSLFRFSFASLSLLFRFSFASLSLLSRFSFASLSLVFRFSLTLPLCPVCNCFVVALRANQQPKQAHVDCLLFLPLSFFFFLFLSFSFFSFLERDSNTENDRFFQSFFQSFFLFLSFFIVVVLFCFFVFFLP